MTHFTVTVCTEDPEKLEVALAPFSEELEVEPYKDYSVSDEPTPEKQWDADDIYPDGIPDGLTWQRYAADHNAHYKLTEDDNAGEYMYVDEDGKPYTMSTYNPKSRWDFWQVGGRWTGRYVIRDGADPAELVTGAPGLQTSPCPDGYCDGGMIRALDLERMGDEAASKALARRMSYMALVAGTPPLVTWDSLIKRKHDGELTIDQCRELYREQPRIKALSEDEDFRWEDEPERWERSEDEVAGDARAQRICGYALLTADGQWKEPGKMGWFGASTKTGESEAEYRKFAAEYIRQLPDTMWLVGVDCHI